jgi:Flp pilus assembly protein TadD
MSWWSRLTGGKSDGESRPGRVDYLSEALALERQGDYDAALTSYRLALRDRPDDQRVLQNMAIALTRTGQVEEAIRYYRRALELDTSLGGAHYGLAFLLLKRGDETGAVEHLEAFLHSSSHAPESERWVRHARQTLATLLGERDDDSPGPPAPPAAPDGPASGAAADARRAPPSAGGPGARF